MGCGGGLASESLARLGAVVTGVDPSGPTLAIAKGWQCRAFIFVVNVKKSALMQIILPRIL